MKPINVRCLKCKECLKLKYLIHKINCILKVNFPSKLRRNKHFLHVLLLQKEKNILLFTRYLRYKIEIKSTETEIHAFIKTDLACGLLSNESVNVLLRNMAMQYHEESQQYWLGGTICLIFPLSLSVTA